ncbi:MAG TPA: energy transducer TonB [Planctomycetota bacterium]
MTRRPPTRWTHEARAVAVSVALHVGVLAFAAAHVVTVAAETGWASSVDSVRIGLSVRVEAAAEPVPVWSAPARSEPVTFATVTAELPVVELPPLETPAELPPARAHDVAGAADVAFATVWPEARQLLARELARRLEPRVVAAPGAPEPAAVPAAAAASDESAFVAARVIEGTNAPPRYPEAARRNGYEGTVTVALDIDEQGRVTAVRVVRSSGHSVLDRAAVHSLGTWRFTPARRAGAAVATCVERRVQFSLVSG